MYTRPRPTAGDPLSAEYPRWPAITGSDDDLAISPNVVVVPNPTQACA